MKCGGLGINPPRNGENQNIAIPPFTCSVAQNGRSPGVKLVGSFTELNFARLEPAGVTDAITSFVLQCK